MWELRHRGKTIATHSTPEACIAEAFSHSLVCRAGVDSPRPGRMLWVEGTEIVQVPAAARA